MSRNGVLSWLRAIKLEFRYWNAVRKCKAADPFNSELRKPIPSAFLVGCGRSGTTLLGSMLALHPALKYVFEPYHLWASLDDANDGTNLFGSGKGKMIRRANECNDLAQRRFTTLFAASSINDKRLLVEKTPHNAMRLSYLNALNPGCRFIHIVRNGNSVCKSIERIAQESTYTIARRANYNSWWGPDKYKWAALSQDGQNAGHFPCEVMGLNCDWTQAAYEWLVSLREIDAHRNLLKGRLVEITYEDLITNTNQVLMKIGEFLDVEISAKWLHAAKSIIQERNRSPSSKQTLPLQMDRAFDEYMERYSYHSDPLLKSPSFSKTV